MISQRSRSAPHTMTRVFRIGGVGVVLLGFACYLVGLAFDGGFVGGLFDGATITLMVLGAYLIGASTWHARRSEQDLREGKHWLPSRDSSSRDSRSREHS